MAGSPRIIARPTHPTPAACRRARVGQGQAFGGAEEAPSLTDAARDGDGNMRSGRKNARGAEQNRALQMLAGSLMKEQHRAQSSTYHREVYMNMLTHIPALASAFVGGVLLHL